MAQFYNPEHVTMAIYVVSFEHVFERILWRLFIFNWMPSVILCQFH